VHALRVQPLLTGQQPDDLADEERVAERPPVDCLGHLAVRRAPRHAPDDLAHVVDAQAGQRHADHGVPPRPVQPRRDVAATRLARPDGHRDDHGVLDELVDGEREQVEAVGVHPLRVVEDDGQRSLRRREEQVDDAAIEPGARTARAVAAGGEDVQRVRRGGRRRGDVRRQERGDLADDRHPGPERGHGSRTDARTVHGGASRRDGPLRDRPEQRRLARAGRCLEDEQRAPPGPGHRHGPVDGGEGRLPAEELAVPPVRGRANGDDGRVRRRKAECRIVPQDARLELPCLGGGVEPELVREQPAQAGQGGQRLGLPSGAVQTERQRAPAPLAERVRRHEPAALGDDDLRVAARETGLEQRLLGGQA